MDHGKILEATALTLYSDFMEKEHEDFKIESSGLVIKPGYPHIGASSDSISYCKCHGKGTVEVKSPVVDKENNLDLKLDTNHSYYYQIQTQLFVLNMNHGDHVVLQPDGDVRIERVLADSVLQEIIVAKSTIFFCKVVLPELVSKYFTSQRYLLEGHQRNLSLVVICKCQQAPRTPMVKCFSSKCKVSIFHAQCVGVKNIRKKWTCPDCQQLE